MKCPNCQCDNREDAKFCNECGNKLEIRCPACDCSNRLGAKFCDECGNKLALQEKHIPKDLSFDEKLEKIQQYLPKGLTEKILSQRNKIEGERKQVTVMFCDMEGFTSLSEKLGPEEAYSTIDKVYEILIHKVHDFEGTVNEMTGDGIVALFGAPIALEDAPQRAIRSALAIHREMVKFSDQGKNQGLPQPIKMRIGIHTGPVVVGTVGNDLRVEFKAVGDTVNLAARVEEIAEPGMTYVTEHTFKSTEGLFLFEALGEKELKGKQEPVGVYSVIAPSTVKTRFDARVMRGLTPFLGRERELELLLDGFQWSKSGRGQAFSIIAEAGMGKSRLLLEFRKAMAAEDVTFFEGNCLSYSGNVAYHPIVDIIKARFNISEEDKDSHIREKVAGSLMQLGNDEGSFLTYVLDLLSVKESGTDKVLLTPEALKNRIIETFKHIVLKTAETQPVIIAIENLHWIDKSSEDTLKYLLESIPGAAILLIFTYRPEYIHSWGARSYHNQINLNRLSNRESLSMIYHLLGTENIDRPLTEMILQKTEGIPLFIEEFIKSLQDIKAIEKKDSTYRIIIDIETVAIPTEIQDIIMARLDSMPEGAKSLAQAGSVIGREFSHELIKRVVDLPEHDLISYLSVLKDSELLYERGIYPQTTYVFKHALIQDVGYNSLLGNTRQKYHQLIAESLEKYFSETTQSQPETLGYHFTEAGLAEPAIPYWKKAGEIASRRSANVEAYAYIDRGLELLKTLPISNVRMRQELDLLITLGSSLIAIKGQATSEVGRIYSRARELCKELGESQHLFTAIRGLYNYYSTLSEYQTCQKFAEELLRIANRQQDQSLLIAAHRSKGTISFFRGEIAEAKFHLEKVVSLYDPKHHHRQAFIYWADQGLQGMCYLILVDWLLGYADQAFMRKKVLLELSKELGHSYSLGHSMVFSPWFFILCRDIHKTKEAAEELIEFSTKQKFPYFVGLGTLMRCWAMSVFGKEKEYISQTQHALDDLSTIGFKQIRPFFLCLLSEAYLNVGHKENGLNILEEAHTCMNKSGERFWEAEIYRLKGELLLSQSTGYQSEGEHCFNQALDVSRHQQAKSLELRVSMSLSRLWQNQGKKEEARNLLSEIYDWFTEGFDTADLKEAKALLEELS